MANTKLPARLLDTSEVPNLNISGTGLGIGTTSTNALINLVEDNSRSSKTGTAQGQIHISGGTDLSNGDVSGITFSTNTLAQVSSIIGNTITNSGSSLFFGTSNSYVSGVTNTAMLIDPSGNIGIGATSPQSRLEIAPPDNSTANKIIFSHFPARADAGDVISGGIESQFRTRDANVNTGAFIRFLDINTNSSYPTQIRGGEITFGTIDGATGFASNPAVERMRIDVSGNVGIGTTDPDCLLHVEDSDHVVARLKTTGTDKQASLRLQNDAQQWGVQCQTTDHFQIENLTVSNIPFQMNPDGYLVLNRNASEYGLQLRSAGTRSGLVIDKPGTSTIMGSLLVLADESYRLGTASYYHVEMKQNGDTKINQNLLLTDSFGLRAYSGYFAAGTSTGTFIFNTYGAGCYEITAAFGHYGYINSYGCFRKAICSNGQGYVSSNSIEVTDIATQITSTNGGSWSFSGYNSSTVPSGSNTTGTVRVVKNAGTYGGGGYYFVEVRGNQSS